MTEKKKELVITGTSDYINRMYNHLREEHPSTRRRMKKIRLK